MKCVFFRVRFADRMAKAVHCILLIAGLAMTLATFAAPVVRTDIEQYDFPDDWVISTRSNYNVEVASVAFSLLETAPFSVVAQTFDLDSTPYGLVIAIR